MEDNNQFDKLDGWQERLLEERKQLLEKTLKLHRAFDNPDIKLSQNEWNMLHRQEIAMREYLQVLTDRCVYYGLLEKGSLHLEYPSSHPTTPVW